MWLESVVQKKVDRKKLDIIIPKKIPGGPPSSPPIKAPPPAVTPPFAEFCTVAFIFLSSDILQQSPITSSIRQFIAIL